MSAGQNSNVGLDVIRGVAALLVVLGHSRAYLADAQAIDLIASGWQKVLLLPTSFAEESVAVFFVLSGYLVGGSVLREVAARKFGWRIYISKRLSRLWTVLIPGVLVTFLVDSLTMRLFAGIWGRLEVNSADAFAAVCNGLFLQVARCDTYGTNDSLWSLSYEFWFYIIFAGAVVAAWGVVRKEWKSSIIGLLVCAVSLMAFGVGLLTLVPSWLLGVGLSVMHNRWNQNGAPSWLAQASKRRYLLAATVTVGAGMLASNFISPPDWAKFIMVGVAAAPLILLSALSPWGSDNRAARWMAWVGGASFSIYVFHLPIVKFWASMLAAQGGLGPVGNTLAVYLLAAISTALTLPLWFITEHRTGVIRTLLMRMLGVHRRPLLPVQ